MLYLLWAAGGWCGTPYPGWWRNPPPPPDPWWWIMKVVGIVGGILGGLLVENIIAGADRGAVAVTASLLGSGDDVFDQQAAQHAAHNPYDLQDRNGRRRTPVTEVTR